MKFIIKITALYIEFTIYLIFYSNNSQFFRFTFSQKYMLNCLYKILIIFQTDLMELIIISLLVCVSLGDNPNLSLSFSDWMLKYSKVYNQTEQAYRQGIYNTNVQKMIETGCDTCGINKFTDQTEDQKNRGLNLLLPQNIQELADKQKLIEQTTPKIVLSSTDSNDAVGLKVGAASSLDWRESGDVTPAKAQGTCGTCWSFTTVGMCESSLIIQGRAFNNKLYYVSLSQQYLLKCTQGSSCSGGYLQNAIDKAISSGLPYQQQFPYNPYSTNNRGVCSTTELIKISNQSRVSKYYVTDDVIISMLATGPIAVAISATGWHNYVSGTYKCAANATINHAVLLVGYTADYWIIKNSWGTDFGDNGFIYVTRNPTYNCGIGTAVHALRQSFLLTCCLLIFVMLCLF